MEVLMESDPKIARLLVDQAPDAVIFAGTDGTIQEWNAAAEALFGHSATDAIGQSLDLIVPERFREAHWKGFDRALGEGDTKYRGQALPTRSMRKDGSDFYVELTFAIRSEERRVGKSVELGGRHVIQKEDTRTVHK